MFYFFFHSKSAKPSVYFQHISVQAGRIFKCSTAACDCCYRHGKRRSRLRQSWLRGCSDFRAREDGGLKEGDEQQELTGERIWRKNPQGLVTGCPGSDRLLSPSGQFSVLSSLTRQQPSRWLSISPLQQFHYLTSSTLHSPTFLSASLAPSQSCSFFLISLPFNTEGLQISGLYLFSSLSVSILSPGDPV